MQEGSAQSYTDPENVATGSEIHQININSLFPPELLVHVFDVLHKDIMESLPFPLPYNEGLQRFKHHPLSISMLVCRGWCDVIKTTPAYWTFVDIGALHHSTVGKQAYTVRSLGSEGVENIKGRLKKAGSLPLYVTVAPEYISNFGTVLEILKEYAHQLETINIVKMPHLKNSEPGLILSALSTPLLQVLIYHSEDASTHLPKEYSHLRDLQWSDVGPDSTFDLVFQRCPRLVRYANYVLDKVAELSASLLVDLPTMLARPGGIDSIKWPCLQEVLFDCATYAALKALVDLLLLCVFDFLYIEGTQPVSFPPTVEEVAERLKRHALLSVMLVCQAWHNLVVTSPRYWTGVQVGITEALRSSPKEGGTAEEMGTLGNGESQKRNLERQLKRCGELPIQVDVGADNVEDFAAIFDVLQNQAHRWQVFNLLAETRNDKSPAIGHSQFLELFNRPLHCLTSLYIGACWVKSDEGDDLASEQVYRLTPRTYVLFPAIYTLPFLSHLPALDFYPSVPSTWRIYDPPLTG
ncbi:hypothetical protein FRC01_004614 [Tulasnella sp. 417]|nr:hypothetical protein FRC01_004614 [Tulasnella sp. 417]